ncbi:MAG: hypothetical protein D3916_09475 [Candidatus Electrothrix sp. MAN1_4]|nr:hypothetical protein [Candidatus Electrothrix sp. MAN1_4]
MITMIKKVISFFQRKGLTSSFLFIFSALIISLIICVCIIGIYSCSLSNNRTGVFATIFMVASSSYAIGNILGLIFGIPKTVQGQTKSLSPQKRISYQVNTSLEQISDWLTKMIIGAGLVELKDITIFLVNISKKISLDINHPHAQSIIVASILCFMILGFFVTYFSIRLYIANALAAANTQLQEGSEEDK